MALTEHPVFLSLTPVFLLIGVGYLAGQMRWIRSASVQDLSNLVFLVLGPALLFTTMSTVQIDELDLRPVGAYFVAVGLLFGFSVLLRGLSCRSVVLALAGTFSNLVMIGIMLVKLAYGQDGLVTLLTLISVHSLVLLTAATILLELAQAREEGAQHASPLTPQRIVRIAASAIKSALIHPVPLPIICGLLFAQTGWALPQVVQLPLQLLGSAFGPLALVLVGVSLAGLSLCGHWQPALGLALSKNLLLPLMVGASAWAFGIEGLALVVLVVAAGLPVGANVYLFAQRYRVVQDLTTATMGVSTLLALLTLSGWMLLLSWLVEF
ncbi:AEC family transporter [Serpentinimonas raichei]|uniref:AEC family transporter n=1 Tax=Serpentinimonas raichei TaxID=1458425 RepID=UPI0009E3D15A|nr:AEC family transporter [Serpentinimonas raichei]